ncbi:hypothetical protein [Photobacterium kishitanii]|uniref:Lysozyme inhibitor LprI N-terminal domain-containing protein n=1 Tax=Photobacterium kishitanii TaxID=318456 RepID=A0A2T3KF46_9GAMM|nr:hypothetical protein [Photobacterium kishitanii]PSU87151.1 hypothetical protein C0W42_17820 [Photobacterium kishitanii]PSU90516.1 hypothetical protein C0W35_16680 [Photobacterium kishitanii]PSU96487.1 hypothetical protein C9J27_16210 [Photobacterium kishitanii]
MRPFSLLCTLFLTIACSSADVAELNNSANIRYDDHCDKYLATQSNDYFNDFISMQLQQVKALKGKITDDNMDQLHKALYQFEAHWLMLKEDRYNACQRHANCTELERQYNRNIERQPRNRIITSSQEMCQKSGFEYAISRIKMVTFYTDVERLELIRQE